MIKLTSKTRDSRMQVSIAILTTTLSKHGFRDTPAHDTGLGAPANQTKHHAGAINDPITCGGVSVSVITGDSEGIFVC